MSLRPASERLAQIEEAVLRLPPKKAPQSLLARVEPRVAMLLAQKRKEARPTASRALPYAALLAVGLAMGGLYESARFRGPVPQQLRGQSGQEEAEVRRRIELLSDPEEHVRAAAAEQLGTRGDPAAIPALKKALEDPSPLVRAAAAKALEQIRAAAAAVH